MPPASDLICKGAPVSARLQSPVFQGSTPLFLVDALLPRELAERHCGALRCGHADIFQKRSLKTKQGANVPRGKECLGGTRNPPGG